MRMMGAMLISSLNHIPGAYGHAGMQTVFLVVLCAARRFRQLLFYRPGTVLYACDAFGGKRRDGKYTRIFGVRGIGYAKERHKNRNRPIPYALRHRGCTICRIKGELCLHHSIWPGGMLLLLSFSRDKQKTVQALKKAWKSSRTYCRRCWRC
jgi:hypothetical protein